MNTEKRLSAGASAERTSQDRPRYSMEGNLARQYAQGIAEGALNAASQPFKQLGLAQNQEPPRNDPRMIEQHSHYVPSTSLDATQASNLLEGNVQAADERSQQHTSAGGCAPGPSELQGSERNVPGHRSDMFPSIPSTASSVPEGLDLYGADHSDSQKEVLLRLEALTSNENRVLHLLLYFWLIIALAFLVWEFAAKLDDTALFWWDFSRRFHLVIGNSAVEDFTYIYINIAIGTLLLVAVTGMIVSHFIRIYSNRSKVWRPRRLADVRIISALLILQWFNLLCWILPNYILLRHSCLVLATNNITYFAGVRWTFWNTIFFTVLVQSHNTNLTTNKKKQSMFEAGKTFLFGSAESDEEEEPTITVCELPWWSVHWWKCLIWLVMEAMVIAMTAYVAVYTNGPALPNNNPIFKVFTSCGEYILVACSLGRSSLILTSLMVTFVLVYWILYCGFLFRAMRQLRASSSVYFRVSNTMVRIQLRLQFPAFAVLVLSLVLLWFVKPFTCNAIVTTWLGMLPCQISSTIAILLTSFLGTPKMRRASGKSPFLTAWLQEYAWTEDEKPMRLEVRNESMDPEDAHLVRKEPMFCVETMMNSLYWSLLVYDFEESVKGRVNIEEGCHLFTPPLTQYELFWDKSLDTKCLLAHSNSRVVLSFRGTTSMRNAMSDLQAWRAVHLPKRGSWYQRPKVHSGFQSAWRSNGLNERILARIEGLLDTGEVDRSSAQILITGHSYGGALASLCAFEVAALFTRLGGDKSKITVITFGAPRTGNRAFAKDFEAQVSDAWSVINDQDIVAIRGKFFLAYKRQSHRVIINRLGDLICRPSPLESSLRLIPCSGSVQQHMLYSYQYSLLAVLLAQFSHQRKKSAMYGAVGLVKRNVPLQKLLLDAAGLEVKDLVAMLEGGLASNLRRSFNQPMSSRKRDAFLQDLARGRLTSEDYQNTRGRLRCGCCAPFFVKVVSTDDHDGSSEVSIDVDVVDGAVTNTASRAGTAPQMHSATRDRE